MDNPTPVDPLIIILVHACGGSPQAYLAGRLPSSPTDPNFTFYTGQRTVDRVTELRLLSHTSIYTSIFFLSNFRQSFPHDGWPPGPNSLGLSGGLCVVSSLCNQYSHPPPSSPPRLGIPVSGSRGQRLIQSPCPSPGRGGTKARECIYSG